MYTKTVEKHGQKTQKKIYIEKLSLRIQNTSNVIAYFSFIWKKHNSYTNQMYKTTQLKLLIIDKMDTFLKKLAKKYCKMLKGGIY